MSIPRVTVTYIYPPIPTRSMDYQAHYVGEEDEQMDVAHGATAAEAVLDLIENHPRGVQCNQVRRCDECIHSRVRWSREHDGSDSMVRRCMFHGGNVEDGSTCGDHEFEGERDQVRTLPPQPDPVTEEIRF